MSDPVQILGELRDATERLDGASKELYRLQVEYDDLEGLFVKSQEAYDDLFNDLLNALIDKYEAEGKRLPGEDARRGMVVKQMRERNPELIGQHRGLGAELRALEKELKRKRNLANSIERSIFSYQSQLSWLKTEAMATGA